MAAIFLPCGLAPVCVVACPAAPVAASVVASVESGANLSTSQDMTLVANTNRVRKTKTVPMP